ncbi:MAG: DUF4422 domain-containing protein [Phascolarctobacterium sp.]|nr:DUF4422 domain-containing protein [Phascolarctobacterium sp.]
MEQVILGNNKGALFVSYHKPYPILEEDFIKAIHAGRACINETKDGVVSSKDLAWLRDNTIGDDSGDNISIRNREYCECTSLYWAWKNIDFEKFDYIGCMQYRRQLILNRFFDDAKVDQEKSVYKCVHLDKDTHGICKIIGLSEKAILELLNEYDCIIPYPTSLEKINITSVYHDWVDKIPGVHVDDLILLENYIKENHAEEYDSFVEYLNSPNKLMYQVFIVKPYIFKEYCEWLFSILFDIDKKVDTSLYTVNGKRTLGYLAEVLYGFYFVKLCTAKGYKVKNCGVTYLE